MKLPPVYRRQELEVEQCYRLRIKGESNENVDIKERFASEVVSVCGRTRTNGRRPFFSLKDLPPRLSHHAPGYYQNFAPA